jgi:hypothetical protein
LKGKFAEAIEQQKRASQDAAWALNTDIDGGIHAAARIAKWEKGELWHP